MLRSRPLTRAAAACLVVVVLPVLGPLACGGDDNGDGGPTEPNPSTLAPAAAAYLDTALLFTQEVFYYGGRVNWTATRAKAFQTAAGAQTFAATYPAIREMIASLDDPHSFFYEPSESLGNREDPATAFYRPAAYSVAPRVGYVWVPTFGGKSQEGRADTIMTAVAKADSTPNLCGWIIDLRGNPGGFWPSMLAGLSPLVTPGRVGGFVERDTVWRYFYEVQPGVAGLSVPPQNGQPRRTIEYLRLPRSYELRNKGLPVAILQGDITASAGEIIVMAFKEPNRAVRTFGGPTYGVTSQPYTWPMADKASVQVTAALMFDRQLRDYAGGAIPPDEIVTGPRIRDNYVPGSASDAVIAAATTWLNAQPSCANAPRADETPAARLQPGGIWRSTAPLPGALPRAAWPEKWTPWTAAGSAATLN
jgi:hypothetical protein